MENVPDGTYTNADGRKVIRVKRLEHRTLEWRLLKEKEKVSAGIEPPRLRASKCSSIPPIVIARTRPCLMKAGGCRACPKENKINAGLKAHLGKMNSSCCYRGPHD